MRRATTLDKIAAGAVLLYAVMQIVSLLGPPIAHLLPLGLLALAAFIYLCVRSMPWIRSRLLWGLRNRLIVTYIFIAVIPILLLLAMTGIGLYLLYPQIGAHLLVDAMQDHVGIIALDADEIVGALVQEIQVGDSPTDPALLERPRVASLVQAAKAEWPGLRVVLQHQPRFSLTGTFRGLTEFRGELHFVSEQRRQSASGPVAVVLAAPVTPSLLDQLTSELGPIQFTVMEPRNAGSQGLTVTTDGKVYTAAGRIVSSSRKLPPPENWFDIKVNGAATLEAYPVDSDTTKYPATLPVAAPVLATFTLRPSTLNKSLFSSVGAIGPILMRIVLVAAAVFLIMELAALATGIALTTTITRSVGDLYEATQFVGQGDLTHRVRVHERDQLGALGVSFNEMTASIANLIEEQRARQRLEHEVAIASEVQQQLFPKTFPSLPGLELGAVCSPARVVSGDYYDFIRIGPTVVGIAVADIAGKGIFAALLMASLQAALRSTASLDGNAGTARLVSQLNAHLFKNTSDDRYATLFYATYHSDTHSLTYTNAGHLAPLLFTNGCVQPLDQGGGTVVGLFENPPFTQVTSRIPPGSLLVAFSDGLTEAANPAGEELGTNRIKDEISRLQDIPPQRIAESLVAMAARWSGTPEQADDVTVVVARMS
jgi:sigma-B regulation protein RsbU (phosphoserine phosphatase)